MAIYRFRITFEDQDDVSRDIEIRSTQNFEDLHLALQNAIGFDASKEASFYMSDDNWKKGKEISSRILSEEEATSVKTMKNSRLCDFIADPHQKIYYVFDFSSQWTFHIELIKIIPQVDPSASYPRCVRTHGEAPRQYGLSGLGAIPVPEDFDPDADLDELEEEEDELEEEVLGTDEGEIPEGEDNPGVFIAADEADPASEDEFETADGDMIDDEGSGDNDEF